MKITKEELLSIIKTEAGPMVAEVIDERMAKAMEEADTRHSAQLDSLVSRIDAKNQAEDRPTLKAARIIRAMAATKGRVDEACHLLKERGHEGLAKALGGGTGSAGGFLISPETGEYVERLSANAVTRMLGARVVPMPNGSISLPAGNTGATANWVGENSVAGSSQPVMRQVTMAAKKLMVIIPISNELLNDASQYADEWVETEAQVASALAEDLAFLRGTGSENSPRGQLYRVTSGNSFNITKAGAAATAAEIYADLGRAIAKLANNDVKMINCGWAMAPRTEWHLKTLLNAHSVPLFAEQMNRGVLLGFPFKSTTQIPINLDTSTAGTDDESDIHFADYYSNVIGETKGVEMKVMDGAAYYDTTSSAVVSGLSQDQTVVVLKSRVDYTSLYEGKDIAILRSVDWGA